MGIFGKPWNMALSDGLYHQNHHWKMGRMSIIRIIRSTWGAKFSIKTISTNQPLSFGYCSWLRRYDQVAPSWHMESWSLSLDAGIFDRRSIHRYIILYMIFLWLFSKFLFAYLSAYFLVFYLHRIIYCMQKSLMDFVDSSTSPDPLRSGESLGTMRLTAVDNSDERVRVEEYSRCHSKSTNLSSSRWSLYPSYFYGLIHPKWKLKLDISWYITNKNPCEIGQTFQPTAI